MSIFNNKGFTILELLVAALITAIVASAALAFFLRTNQQYFSQDEIAEMQQNIRASIQEIAGELRMAGYNIPDTIPPVEIDSLLSGPDTLVIHRDTLAIKFYVDESDTLHPCLIKDVNGVGNIFADEIESFDVSVVGSSSVRITLTATSARADDQIMNGDRFRKTASLVVNMRNL
jgi:prepilin-type N-terminal cleavage/methylation domain-containing protein